MADADLDLRYDQVSFVGTHNAYTGYFTGLTFDAEQNQTLTIAEQLRMGVRFLQLDIYRDEDGRFYCKHGGWPPTVPLSTCLQDVAEFMTVTDPRSVIGIGIEPHLRDPGEESIRAEIVGALLAEFDAAGLGAMMFHPDNWEFDEFQRWPTLRKMIDSNWRLVVFSQDPAEAANPGDRRLMHQYAYMVENVYDEPSVSPPTWTDARKESRAISATDRGLFLMNHFQNFTFFANAEELNDAQDLARQIADFHDFYFRTPNFINVNNFERGNNGGALQAAKDNAPAVRLLEHINLAKRIQMTGNFYIEVKDRYEGQAMVVQMMDDLTVTIQPKSDHPGQRWTPLFVQGGATGVAFINIDKNAKMRAISAPKGDSDVKMVDFDPDAIPDDIIWKNTDRTNSSEYKAIQYAKNDSSGLNVRGRVKTGNRIARWKWNDGGNERWRFQPATD